MEKISFNDLIAPFAYCIERGPGLFEINITDGLWGENLHSFYVNNAIKAERIVKNINNMEG